MALLSHRAEPQGRHGAVGAEDLVGVDGDLAFFLVFLHHGHNLVFEQAGRFGCRGFLVGGQGEFGLFLAADLVLGGDLFAAFAHQFFGDGAEESVFVEHVQGFLFAHAEAPPRCGQDVGHVGGGFHASGDDHLSVAQADPVGGEHDGSQA